MVRMGQDLLMHFGEIISAVISGVAVILLASIARGLRKLSADVRRFMTEHVWLLATTMWTRDKVIRVMAELGMPAENPPPSDLPKH